jgi:hypothetical protein
MTVATTNKPILTASWDWIPWYNTVGRVWEISNMTSDSPLLGMPAVSRKEKLKTRKHTWNLNHNHLSKCMHKKFI